jgi:hypothetical protein
MPRDIARRVATLLVLATVALAGTAGPATDALGDARWGADDFPDRFSHPEKETTVAMRRSSRP